MPDINRMSPGTGRRIKEDGTIVNLANIIEDMSNAGIQLTGNTLRHGQKSVTTAGTRVALGTTQPLKAITILAKDTNTGNIYVGGNTVTSANGFILPPGAGHSWTGSGLDVVNIYIDSDVNGGGVSWSGVE